MDPSEQLIQLSITNLFECLDSEKREQFREDKPKEYPLVIKAMREESTVIALRKFHNWVKLILITEITGLAKTSKGFKNSKVSLMDIAVGRGGDISKWNKAGISNVFGFDKNMDSIKSKVLENPGAEERLRSFVGNKVNITFETGDITRQIDGFGIESKITNYLRGNKINGFDMVSCQFALHYFFINEQSIRNVFQIVDLYLKPGGYFFGTTIDGKKLREYMSDSTDSTFQRTLFRIESFFKKRLKSPWGNRYSFKIFDNKSSNNYFNSIPESMEYLVDFEVLNKIAKEFSLEPVEYYLFEKYTTDTGKMNYSRNDNSIPGIIPFKNIYDRTYSKNGDTLSTEEKELSFLNSVFIFRKKF